MAYLMLGAGVAAFVGAALCFALARVQPAPWRWVDQVLGRPGTPEARRRIGMDPNGRGIFPVRVSHGIIYCLIGITSIIGAVARFRG